MSKKSPSNAILGKYLKKTKNEYAQQLSENRYPIVDYISTGNLALNVLISADPNKGVPTGRIVSWDGPASVGKCHGPDEEIEIFISEEDFNKFFS